MAIRRSSPEQEIQQPGEAVAPSARVCGSSQLTHAVVVQANRQDVSSKALVSHLSSKVLSRYEHKINLGNQPTPLTLTTPSSLTETRL